MAKKTKFLFVTGGVISGLGKGISAASIGNLLKAYGHSVFVLKLDPYLNIDPGLISPYEHGEVFVTKDGGETDLDLGHYERFIDVELTKSSNYTSGKLFAKLFEKERNGVFLGKTVQYIPHFIEEIIEAIMTASAEQNPDFMIVELGGTVGDIESSSFVYALSELKVRYPEQFYLIHVAYVPFLSSSKEFKSKPLQNSLELLGSYGLKADILLLRSEHPVDQHMHEKIAIKARMPQGHIISVPDFSSIYDVPQYLEKKGLTDAIHKHFQMQKRQPNFGAWSNFISLIKSPKKFHATILMVGKYVEFLDAYKTLIEALKTASYYEDIDLKLLWAAADELTEEKLLKLKSKIDGVVILPGFGIRGFEAKVMTATFTRQHLIPTFGICLGMQAMTVAQARLKGYQKATSAEFSNDKNDILVLDILKGRHKDYDMGGTLRLGNYEITLFPGTKIHQIYQQEKVIERHRHRYEVTKEFFEKLNDGEFVFSGIWKKNHLAESCELKSHPFYLGTQFHPEFTSRPLKPHPLFCNFLKTVVTLKEK